MRHTMGNLALAERPKMALATNVQRRTIVFQGVRNLANGSVIDGDN